MALVAMNPSTLERRARNLFEKTCSRESLYSRLHTPSLPDITTATLPKVQTLQSHRLKNAMRIQPNRTILLRIQPNPPPPASSTTLIRLHLPSTTTDPKPTPRLRQPNQPIPPPKRHTPQHILPSFPPHPPLTLLNPRLINPQKNLTLHLPQPLRRRQFRRAVDERRYACGLGVGGEGGGVA